jgi:hypothetical protein
MRFEFSFPTDKRSFSLQVMRFHPVTGNKDDTKLDPSWFGIGTSIAVGDGQSPGDGQGVSRECAGGVQGMEKVEENNKNEPGRSDNNVQGQNNNVQQNNRDQENNNNVQQENNNNGLVQLDQGQDLHAEKPGGVHHALAARFPVGGVFNGELLHNANNDTEEECRERSKGNT